MGKSTFHYKRIPIGNINTIKTAWENMCMGKDMTVFQSYQWHELQIHWYHISSFLHKIMNLYEIWAIYKEDILKMIIPIRYCRLSLKARKGLHFIGFGNYSDYCNLIYDDFDPACFEFALKELKAEFGPIPFYLEGLIENTALEKYLNDKGFVGNKRVAVYVDIEDDVESYQKKLSKSTRQNLRTALNRMKKKEINYRYFVYDQINDKNMVDTLIDVHLKRNIEKNKRNNWIFNFLRKIRQTLIEKRHSIISELMQNFSGIWILVVFCDEEIAGYLLGIYDHKIVRVIQNCVNSDFGFYSPTFRAVYDYIIECTEKNNDGQSSVLQIDFTSGNEPYKYKLNGKERYLYDYKINL